MSLMRWLFRHVAGSAGQARFVRRVEMRCPHGDGDDPMVEIELLMGRTGMPSMVLHCSHRREAPPTCDQRCRRCAEAVVSAPRSLLLVPSKNLPAERGH